MSPTHRLAPLSSRRLQRLPLALLLAGSAHWLPAHADEPQQAAVKASDSQLKTVTVTARRREESAQDVPTPMSVLDGQALESQRIYRIQDLQQLVPSVNVAYMHARQSSVSIRGLGNN
ncbi:MAG: TonB-dependent receptor plug domain-containing protein, partial [Pseudomonas sp.]